MSSLVNHRHRRIRREERMAYTPIACIRYPTYPDSYVKRGCQAYISRGQKDCAVTLVLAGTGDNRIDGTNRSTIREM